METISKFFEDSLRKDLHLKGPSLPNENKIFFETPLRDNREDENFSLFVGRKKNLQELSFSISETMKGLYNKIIIYGESGTGKTTLLNLISRTIRKVYPDSIVLFIHEEAQLSSIEQIKCKFLEIAINELTGSRAGYYKEKVAIGKIEKYLFKTDIIGQDKEKLTIEKAFADQGLCEETDDVILKYFDKIKNKKIVLQIDNSEALIKNQLLFSQTLELVNKIKAITIFSFYPETVENLVKEKNEIIKSSRIIEIEPLTANDCKEILRRRLFFGKNNLEAINNEPNYLIDLKPFNEEFVETVAGIANNLPLKFIQLLKQAVSCARENGYEVIDNRCMLAMAKPKFSEISDELIELTDKQRALYNFIGNKK